jgi:hypothetical protein
MIFPGSFPFPFQPWLRSLDGWSEMLSLRRSGERVPVDERISGSGAFVERMLRGADERIGRQFSGRTLREKACAGNKEVCEEEGITELDMTEAMGCKP